MSTTELDRTDIQTYITREIVSIAVRETALKASALVGKAMPEIITEVKDFDESAKVSTLLTQLAVEILNIGHQERS